MRRLSALVAVLFLALPFTLAEEPTLAAGRIIDKVICSDNPQQTYALYLPSRYSPAAKWPIIYVFDPMARGDVAVEAIHEAAEQYGYIVAASNNSRNGSFGDSSEAANAISQDTHERLSIDDRRVYVAGFSGGARLATEIAILCKTCIAGVLASGAGFPINTPPSKDIHFAYFLAVGNADFNFPEGVALRQQLEQVHAVYRIRNFDGGHEWAPSPVWKEALGWMDLQAMRSGSQPKEANTVQQIFQQELELARAGQKTGKLLASQREYQYMARDFDGLTDTSEVKTQLAQLKSEKQLKSEEKQERADVDRQAKLAGKASAQMQGILTNDTDMTTYAEITRTMVGLKADISKASNQQDPSVLVMRRALGQLVVQAYESGDRALEQKNYPAALKYFDLLVAGTSSPGGALYERARVYAAQGDAQKCLSELQQAQAAGFHDPKALQAAEFNQYRQLPQFRDLQSEWNKQARP